MSFIKKAWGVIADFFTGRDTQIMIIDYDVDTKQIECKDWISQTIIRKTISPELWTSLKPLFRLETPDRASTRIYIWSKKECLAYCEPIDNYIDRYALLSTGQGFPVSSGVRYGESMAIKCKCCGRKWPEVY